MTGKEIDEKLFQYVDDHAGLIEGGDLDGNEEFDPEWEIFTFCQLFFDQFFGQFGTNIRGFTQRSREAATMLIETLKAAEQASKETREIVVRYEEFCDMNDNISRGYGAPTKLTLSTFHEDYLVRLLTAAREWAASEDKTSLSQRISVCLSRYSAAVEKVQWVT